MTSLEHREHNERMIEDERMIEPFPALTETDPSVIFIC